MDEKWALCGIDMCSCYLTFGDRVALLRHEGNVKKDLGNAMEAGPLVSLAKCIKAFTLWESHTILKKSVVS